MSLVHIIFLFSSLAALVLSQCVLPPPPAGVTPINFEQETLGNGRIVFQCPASSGDIPNLPYGNYGVGGPLLTESTAAYICDPADGKFLTAEDGKKTMLTTVTCRLAPDLATLCLFNLNGIPMIMENGQADFKCPGQPIIDLLPEGFKVTSLRCSNSLLMADITGTGEQPVGSLDDVRNVFCKEVPTTTSTTTTTSSTTTSTAATTTTKKPDSPASASQLWNVNYYYNYGVGVHAYCADQACINAIQSNGIGYDMNNGKGLMGRAIAESQINSIRASCPTGSQSLRNLGFTKYGNKYGHNLNGSGIKQGWVSISRGACGATVGIKRWKSRYTDDLMYGVDLEWNTWYQGMVQEGGQVHFYMWN